MVGKRKRSPFAIRGIMVDPARLTERHAFYFELLGRMAAWGMNTLWWHFADDEGFRLKLDSHPELASPYAFGKPEMRRLIRAATEAGIDVVPEVESLGHARYITALPQYAHLADGRDGHFNAICPSHPQTLTILGEIIAEVAELFESEYVHAGLDEVDFGGCLRCARRARGRPRGWVYTEHAKAIHEIITRCGKRMLMWADHVEGHPRMLTALPRDIVLCHWQYTAVRPEPIARSLDAGFEVVLAPSMLHAGDVIQPNAANFRNLDEMAALGARLGRRGVLGVVNTWWVGRRIVRDAALPAAAYTGEVLSAGASAEKRAFFGRYARRRFGLRGTAAADALWRMHELTLHADELNACLFDSPADVRDAVNFARGEGFAERAEGIGGCVSALAASRERVRAHAPEYDASLLAARIAALCMEQAGQLSRAVDHYAEACRLQDAGARPAQVAGKLGAALTDLGQMRDRLDAACRAVEADWNRTRHPRDPDKAVRDPAAPCPRDHLLGRLVRAREYLRLRMGTLRREVAAVRGGGRLRAGL